MLVYATLQKSDADLFSLDYRDLRNVPSATADRLMAAHLIEAVEMLDGYSGNRTEALQRGITRRGRLMVIAVLHRHNSRFIAPLSWLRMATCVILYGVGPYPHHWSFAPSP